MSKKAIVLSSGGLDSTTCLSIAVDKYGKDNVSTLSIYYGQKHDKELKCAQAVADYYGVKHYVKDISTVMDMSDCALLKTGTKEIKHESYVEQIKEDEIVSTYVPFRNGLLLSCATAIAVSIYPDDEVEIYYGAHADDYAGNAYADCSPEFATAMNEAINKGSYGRVNVVAPLINENKAGVVSIGKKLGTPYHLTWSCYEGKEKACGTCGTCIDRLEAFRLNNMEDPIEYERR
jgi:7-cyano-7-deazaguanine synthase